VTVSNRNAQMRTAANRIKATGMLLIMAPDTSVKNETQIALHAFFSVQADKCFHCRHNLLSPIPGDKPVHNRILPPKRFCLSDAYVDLMNS
jgi:hypothetical protein